VNVGPGEFCRRCTRMNPAVLVLSAPFGRDASGVGAEATAMIEYTCPACGVSMASPASLAGRTERCPACSAVCRVPVPVAAAAVPASPASPPVAAPRCPFCGGSMDRSHTGSGVVAQLLLALLSLAGVAICCLFAVWFGLLVIAAAIVLDVACRPRSVLRCRSCGAVVPRA